MSIGIYDSALWILEGNNSLLHQQAWLSANYHWHEHVSTEGLRSQSPQSAVVVCGEAGGEHLSLEITKTNICSSVPCEATQGIQSISIFISNFFIFAWQFGFILHHKQQNYFS